MATQEQAPPFLAQLADTLAQSIGMLHDQQEHYQDENREQFRLLRDEQRLLSMRMKEVCDKGGREHAFFYREIAALKRFLMGWKAREQGRKDIIMGAWGGFSWLVENGGKLAGFGALVVSSALAIRVFLFPAEPAAAGETPTVEMAAQPQPVAKIPADPSRALSGAHEVPIEAPHQDLIPLRGAYD